MLLRFSTRPRPISLLALALVGWGAFTLLQDRGGGGGPPCDPAEATCSPGPGEVLQGTVSGAPPTLSASDTCIDVGYLCAGLAQTEVIRLQRWRDFEGTIVVHVPVPDIEDRSAARALQRAAAQGVRAWSGQPFEILADMIGDRNPHFAVEWSRSLNGSQIGVARTQWSPSSGLKVLSIELVTRSPFSPSQTSDPRQVRLTAAHEMGHALGLQHSDAARDIMYSTNTANSMSAQDYRSIEVLYQMQDGTQIRR
jgi:predicted Zn-dependent protease